MKSQVLHTVRCYISGEAAREFEIDHSQEWKGWALKFLFTDVKRGDDVGDDEDDHDVRHND